MMFTTDDIEKIDYQRNRKDSEAILLREYLDKEEKILEEYRGSELCHKLINEAKDETRLKLNLSTYEEFEHKLLIYCCLCDDDERVWREQKYGTQTKG